MIQIFIVVNCSFSDSRFITRPQLFLLRLLADSVGNEFLVDTDRVIANNDE